MEMFPWKVYDHEKSSAYYKSLMLDDVAREDHDHDDVEDRADAMEEGATSIQHTKTLRSKNSDQPASKKRLFHGDVETPKSKLKTSVLYTIPELYTCMENLITQQIKESKGRMKHWIAEEIAKIAKQNKVGDTSSAKKSREMKEKGFDRDDSNMLDENVHFVNDIHDDDVDQKGDRLPSVENDLKDFEVDREASVETDVDSFVEKVEDKSVVEKAEGDSGVEKAEDKSKIEKAEDKSRNEKTEVESVVEKDNIDSVVEKDEADSVVEKAEDESNVEVQVVGKKSKGDNTDVAKKPICVDDFPSPDVYLVSVLPTSMPSVIWDESVDPSVVYKNDDKERSRRRSRFLLTPYVDPMPETKKKGEENQHSKDFTTFLKGKNEVRIYTGQPVKDMTRSELKDFINTDKWISNSHIDSYFDVLWKKRLGLQFNYWQDIGLVSPVFFLNLNIQWKKIVLEIQTQRQLQEFEKEDRIRIEEAEKAGEDGSDKEVIQQCVKKKKKGHSPLAVCEKKEVWEDYLEFNPLDFHPDNEFLHYVRGHDLLYNEPWWKMNSVLIPCNVGDHWVISEVFLKEGKVRMFDSWWGRQ